MEKEAQPEGYIFLLGLVSPLDDQRNRKTPQGAQIRRRNASETPLKRPGNASGPQGNVKKTPRVSPNLGIVKVAHAQPRRYIATRL